MEFQEGLRQTLWERYGYFVGLHIPRSGQNIISYYNTFNILGSSLLSLQNEILPFATQQSKIPGLF